MTINLTEDEIQFVYSCIMGYFYNPELTHTESEKQLAIAIFTKLDPTIPINQSLP